MLLLLERTYISVFRRYPTLLRLALVALFAEIVFSAVNNYALTFYINKDLALPMSVAGDIVAAFLIAEMLLKFPMGHLSDRYDRRRFAGCGLAICIGAPLAICVLTPSVFHPGLPFIMLYLILGPLRFIDGAGSAAVWPPLFASVPDHIPTVARGVAMSVMNTAYLVGLAIGPALAGGARSLSITTGHPDWASRAPFALVIVLSLIGSAIAWSLPARKSHVEQFESPSSAALPPFRVIAMILVITFTNMFATSTLAPIIGPYLNAVDHIDRNQVGLLMLLLVLPAAVFGIPIGHLTDRWPKRRVVQASLWATAIGMWGILCAQSLAQRLGGGALVMAGFMFGLPSWLSLITDLAPESGYGKIMGIMATAQGCGAVLGPIVSGRLWDINLHYPFFLSASLLTCSAMIALFCLHPKHATPALVAARREGEDDSDL